MHIYGQDCIKDLFEFFFLTDTQVYLTLTKNTLIQLALWNWNPQVALKQVLLFLLRYQTSI